ncbi:OmpA family protein [Variovorax terrae]|uniref:OmpA family protein n=1 Tax=Variovorax terrae TaxID=2923278 RepID=A0A9X1VR60_9BURK|nr:OmpA family protein [Variovorax terrae]MCJ0762311.1 OmpA family protein [Variovorax terrae]
MLSQDDDSTGIALGVVFGVIALVIGLVIGVAVYQTRIAGEAKAVPVVVEIDAASVKVENGVVKFYFATARAELAPGANEALAEVVKSVAEGRRAVVSGFHDATGDAAKNEELSKQRALAVREALKGLGVAEDKVELRKPELLTGTGSNAEARRVEVIVVQ